jgi:ankyrin repeat protein
MDTNTKLMFDFFHDLNHLYYYQEKSNSTCYQIYLLAEEIIKNNSIDFFQKDEHGNTLLHYAFLYQNSRYVHVLLKKGLNPFSENNKNINCFQMIKNQKFLTDFWKQYKFYIQEKNMKDIIHIWKQFHIDFRQRIFEKESYYNYLNFISYIDFLEKTNLKNNKNILYYFSQKIEINDSDFHKLILYASQNQFSDIENSLLLFNFKNVEQNSMNQKIFLTYLEKNSFAIDDNYIKFLYYFGTHQEEMYSKHIQASLIHKLIDKNHDLEKTFHLQKLSGKTILTNMKNLLKSIQLFPLYENELLQKNLPNKNLQNSKILKI